MPNINRKITDNILKSLQAFPAVYIAGPRQSGKTTLVEHISNTHHHAQYISFDDIKMRSAAKNDPEDFLSSLEGNIILDEIQMVPEIFRQLKIIIDKNRKLENGGRGKFLLTGSAHIMSLPKLSDALVGRMSLHNLLPFSSQETDNNEGSNFIDQLFANEKWHYKNLPESSIIDKMKRASFPEIAFETDINIINQWCNGYINTILQRDIIQLMEIDKAQSIPNLLQIIAARTSSLLNNASLSRETGLNIITVRKYLTLLSGLFLINTLPAWSNNLSKRLIKTPKIYLSDINLLSYFLNSELDYIKDNNSNLFGKILENFVAIELTKQQNFAKTRTNLYHYRTATGQEIDFILEGTNNQIVGIEVKARKSITSRDFNHLKTLQNDLGDSFLQGIVLYQGSQIIPFGKNMWAIPVSIIWTLQ